MVSIKPPPTSWKDAILQAARTQMNADVCFYREVSTGPKYNPVTGTGGNNGIAVFWRGKARVQHVRAPQEFEVGYQEGTSQNYLWQLDPDEPGNSVPFLPSGVKARVIAGGRNSKLESLAFVVTSDINSSHMAVNTVKLQSNMKPIEEWLWNPDGTPLGLFPAEGLFPSFKLFPLKA